MTKKRVFPRKQIAEKAEDYHGGARYTRASPDVYAQGVKSLNLEIPFDEALKLHLAIESCLLNLNRFNRGTKKGRSMGMLLSIKMDNCSITVIDKQLPSLLDQ